MHDQTYMDLLWFLTLLSFLEADSLETKEKEILLILLLFLLFYLLCLLLQ